MSTNSTSSLKGRSPVILLAEDSDDDAFFFQRALTRTSLPCSITRAVNGKIAIEMLQKTLNDPSREAGLPDLIFLDLKMPVTSGFDVLEWLKGANLNPLPKVIVLSGSNDAGDRRRASELGASDYLVKPITSDELRVRLQSLNLVTPGRVALETEAGS